MKIKDDNSFVKNVYEARSILVKIEQTPDGWVHKEFQK